MEVESKFVDFDKDLILKKLSELGAKKIFDGKLYTAYYAVDRNTFQSHKWIRVREILSGGQKTTMLTMKYYRSIERYASAEEYEWEVLGPDREHLEKQLCFIGLKCFLRIEKRRTSYLLEGLGRIEFDKPLGPYSIIPQFIELEASSEESLLRLASLLNLEMDKAYSSFVDIMKKYGIKEYVECSC